jgi:hypothetical protein
MGKRHRTAGTGSGTVGFEFGDVRVQILAPTLVRLEQRGLRGFEDRPSFHVHERCWPGAPVQRLDSDRGVVLKGEFWSVRVPAQVRELSEIQILDPRGRLLHGGAGRLDSCRWLPAPGDRPLAWAIGDHPRILPPCWGATPAPAGSERAGTSGWDLDNDAPDLYVFLPGGEYLQLRADLLRLTGPTELPPLYLFGAFHSRFYPYTDRGALGVIREYRERGLPLDVFMVDTDWRLNASFGYDENLKLFPDLPGFLAEVHRLGLKVGFNDHPKPLAEHALDPAELAFRFTSLSRWLLAGLDFWWFDRNWEVCLAEPAPGLGKEVWGMELYRDMTLRAVPERRPLVMANVDGIDNGQRNRPGDIAGHRYPFQWTGDTWVGWNYLRWGVENAVHAGVHSLVPYVSEDTGTHQGIPSPEFYLRSYQAGACSAVLRPHCSDSPFFRREPWSLGPEVAAAARELLRMRYRLLPHLYAAARRNYDTGEPLLRRLDLGWPEHPEAARDDQYLLGDGLLVAPILEGEPCNQPVPAAWLRGPEGGPGLRVEGFRNHNLLGEPVLEGPHGSTRWSGWITPDRAIQLGIQVEAGARLWLDRQLVVDQWLHSTWNLGVALEPLAAGRTCELRLEARGTGGAIPPGLFFLPMELPEQPVSRSVWIPDGEWLDAWTGDRVQGPSLLQVRAGAEVIPLFIQAGSLFALAPDMLHTGEKPWDPITLDAYPVAGRTARTELYEDDGATNDYLGARCRRSQLEARLDPVTHRVLVRIGRAEGGFAGAIRTRAWALRLHVPPELGAPQQVRLDGQAVSGWRLLAKGPAPTPFQLRGPALDGPVLEVELPAKAVGRARAVEVRFRP